MLSEGVYTISELQRILAESANESKPKIDQKVIRDDAQNNAKAVKDIMKETGAMEDKATNEKRDTPPENLYDTNKTTLDVNFAYVPSKEYKDRVKSQVHGFASKEHEKMQMSMIQLMYQETKISMMKEKIYPKSKMRKKPKKDMQV